MRWAQLMTLAATCVAILFPASSRAAQGVPPEPTFPINGSRIPYSEQIHLSVTSSGSIVFYEVATTDRVDPDGQLTDLAALGSMTRDGSTASFHAVLGTGASPPLRPGTYYWHAYRDECNGPPVTDCINEGPALTFSVGSPRNPEPTSPPSGTRVSELLGPHQIRAQVPSELADARPGFEVSLANEVGLDGMFEDGLNYGANSFGDGDIYAQLDSYVLGRAGEYELYWHAYALDCLAEPDCRVVGPTRSLQVDNRPPETRLLGHPFRSTAKRRPRFSFTSSALDLAGFQCRFDQGPWQQCFSPWRPTHRLALGRRTFAVRAYDDLGNVDVGTVTRFKVIA
ncbi:MAG: hypothetical protein U0R24_03990 [Solirubrobacterales bacterium]